MAATDIIIALLNPWLISLLYWPAGVFIWGFFRLIRFQNKFEAMRFKTVNGVRIAIRSAIVPIQKTTFAPRKGETHTLQKGDFAWLQADTFGAHAVAMFDTDKQRAIKPQWMEGTGAEDEDPEDMDPGKLKLIRRVHNPKGKASEYSINPDAQDADDLLTRQTLKQLIVQNLQGHPGLLIMVILILAGFGGGWIVHSLASPPQVILSCPTGDVCSPVQTATSTSTGSTITA